jgi:ATP-binding cassette subfamily B protein
LYDPTEGVVSLDDADIQRIPIKDLRHAVGHVLHETQIFTGTIAENISYGAPDASPMEIQQAASVVGLHDFIQSQDKGYETKLGRGGITLNPEQLVELSMARALVMKPSVLTVDDTYSAIEEDVEKQIRKAVRESLAEKTILIATSRLSICEDADLVVVMQEGKVVQVGAHEELLGVPGLYRRMYMRQMGLGEPEAALDS